MYMREHIEWNSERKELFFLRDWIRIHVLPLIYLFCLPHLSLSLSSPLLHSQLCEDTYNTCYISIFARVYVSDVLSVRHKQQI